MEFILELGDRVFLTDVGVLVTLEALVSSPKFPVWSYKCFKLKQWINFRAWNYDLEFNQENKSFEVRYDFSLSLVVCSERECKLIVKVLKALLKCLVETAKQTELTRRKKQSLYGLDSNTHTYNDHKKGK